MPAVISTTLPGTVTAPAPKMDVASGPTAAPTWPAGGGGFTTRIVATASTSPFSSGDYYLLMNAVASVPFTVGGEDVFVRVGRRVKGKLFAGAVDGLFCTEGFADPLAALQNNLVADYAKAFAVLSTPAGAFLSTSPILGALAPLPAAASLFKTVADAAEGARWGNGLWSLRLAEKIAILSGASVVFEEALPTLALNSDTPWPASVVHGKARGSLVHTQETVGWTRLKPGQYSLRSTFTLGAGASAMTPMPPYLVTVRPSSASIDVSLDILPFVRRRPRGGDF